MTIGFHSKADLKQKQSASIQRQRLILCEKPVKWRLKIPSPPAPLPHKFGESLIKKMVVGVRICEARGEIRLGFWCRKESAAALPYGTRKR
jgi:hypothetical protein